MKPEARAFINEMLRELRREFFANYDDKRFFQERPMLIRAITAPAAYLDDRGAEAPEEEYRAVIRTVVATIKRHGNRAKIERFSAYFVHCVQERLKHHGDELYDRAKTHDGRVTTPRPIGQFLPETIRKIDNARGPDLTTRVLAEAHRAVRSPGGRRPRIRKTEEVDLFSACTGDASSLQKPRKLPKPLSKRADSPVSPQT